MKVSKYKIYILLSYLAIFPPLALTDFSQLKSLFNVFQIALFLFYFVKIINDSKSIPKILFSPIVYSTIIVVSTIINNRPLFSSLIFFVNLVGYSIFFFYELNENSREFISTTRLYFEIIFYLNFVVLIYKHYFLGIDVDNSFFVTVPNSISSWIIFALVICFLEDFYLKKISLRTVIFTVMLTITELLLWSATGLVGYFIVLIFLLYVCVMRKIFKYNYLLLFLISAILFIVITFGKNETLLSFFIEDVLQKDSTFTGRDIIWQFYIKEILKSPIIGYGAVYTPFQDLVAHSGWLTILLDGGIVLLFVFILINLSIHKKIKRNKNNIYITLLSISLFSFLIMMVAEMPIMEFFFGFFILLAFYSDFFKKNDRTDNLNEKND